MTVWMKPLTCSGLLLLCLSLSGCGTLMRGLAPSEPQLYPATRDVLHSTRNDLCWSYYICPLLLVGLPVDLVVDTLLLPVDALRVAHQER